MPKSADDIVTELLVLKSQDGDEAALARLVNLWQPRLYRHTWRMIGQADAAQDAAQEAWLAIVRRLNRLDDPAAFPAWAYRIATNKAVDVVRKRKLDRQLIAESKKRAASPGPDDVLMDGAARDEQTNILRQAIAQLPPDRRAMLALRYLDELGVKQIAKVFGISTGTVKSRLFHAREQLRETMKSMTRNDSKE